MSIATRRMQRAVHTQTAGTRYSLWPSNPTPGTISDADTAAVELGVKFRSSVAAQVLGVRFYKGPQNTGTHSGSLWTTGGVRLATVTFTGETASGWQEMLFASPVAISANTTYVASYFAPNGRYSSNQDYFASDYVNAMLTAPQTSTSPNGVYVYAASSSFPTNTFSATNYWVDVIVELTPDTQAPSAPTNLQASASGALASLVWTASTDNIAVAGYRIYRDGLEIGTSVTTAYSDTSASPSTAYSYTVRAYDYANNLSAVSNMANVTTGANMQPSAAFTYNTSSLTLYVDATTSADPDGTVVNYDWDFGDGSTGTGSTASHTYVADGAYTVELTVTDNNNATDVDSQSVSVAWTGYADAFNTGIAQFGLQESDLTPYSGPISFGNTTQSFDQMSFDIQNDRLRVLDGAHLTFTKCHIRGPVDCDGDNRSVTLIDCTIDGNGDVLAVGYSNVTLIRCNVFNGTECVNGGSNIYIEDSYIHHPYLVPNSDGHVNPLFNGGGTNITCRGSTFWSPVEDNGFGGGTTTNLSFFGDFAVVENVLVENCFIKSTPGAYGVTLGYNPGKPYGDNPTNVVFRNNTFERGPTGHNAAYGPVTSFLAANGNQFYGNKYEDGEVINP